MYILLLSVMDYNIKDDIENFMKKMKFIYSNGKVYNLVGIDNMIMFVYMYKLIGLLIFYMFSI